MRKNKNTSLTEQTLEVTPAALVVETETISEIVDSSNTEDIDDSTLNIAAELLHYPLERVDDVIQEPLLSIKDKTNNRLSFVILGITPNTGKTAVEIDNVVYETNVNDLKGLIRHIETHIHKAGF